ncbi:MAG TPA: alpha-ketoacid dehydrogenase subunit beta, partial [Candidatus Margulisiibacteriota bacterium]|nr:alpha-ketoacid dehydrogenase subunit beta [Candidatus Margulisiibacteriota bacterium]
MRELTYWQALQEALREEMQRDPAVFLMGEDIGAYGGAFGVTRGLLAEFGAERVRCTPISEASIVGAAIGAALTGMRPVVEIMFMDFLTLAMDQLANHAAKVRYMYGPQVRVPLVLRTPAGGGRCYGATHSQSLEAWFLHVPGVKVIAPATPADAKALLRAAIRDDNPVLCVEHKLLYATTGPVPDDGELGGIGRAVVRRPGRDVTLVAYSYYVGVALEAAQQLAGDGIEAEVLDLRSLVPMDSDAILASVRKTGRLVCVEEGTRTGGVGAEIAARVAEDAYEYLDAPIRRVAAADVPIPFSPALEPLALPQSGDIVGAVRR